jgi:hypothetical protein
MGENVIEPMIKSTPKSSRDLFLKNYLMPEGLTDTLKKGEDDDPSRPRILLQGARK